MMMNDFGTPMTEADINMSSNPAKAMLEQQLATTGVNNQIFGKIFGAVTSIFGAKKSADSAAAAAQMQNKAIEATYKYDVKKWNMDKKAAKAKHAFYIKQLKQNAKNEKALAKYKDKTNLQNYNYLVEQIDLQQDLNDKAYKKSNDIYKEQLKINALEEDEALNNQHRALEEIRTENRYEQMDAQLDSLVLEGQIAALGQTGNTAAKRISANTLQAGTKLTLLDLSLQNATVASQAAMRGIRNARTVADLNAEAAKMLDPGTLPKPPKPIATPTAAYVFPKALKDYDFGPKPIKGAKASPSAAAAGAWGAGIQGIAGSVGDIAGGIYKHFTKA